RFVVDAQGERRLDLELTRVFDGDLLVGELQAISDEHLARAALRRRLRTLQEHAPALPEAARVPVVLAHERLDARPGAAVAELAGDELLLIEAQPVGAPPRVQMQEVAHPP